MSNISRWNRISLALLFIILFFTLGCGSGRDTIQAERKLTLGTTLSIPYMEWMGLEWEKVFEEILSLDLQEIRLPVYWNRIESISRQYDFSELDRQIDYVASHGMTVILAMGLKSPRWPECHVPDWVSPEDKDYFQERILDMLSEVVGHYSDNRTITMWQVENEPLLLFGICPPPDPEFLKQEIELVRTMDPLKRPIMTTESGDLRDWREAAELGDILGINIYTISWSEILGSYYYHYNGLSPDFLEKKRLEILELDIVDDIIVTELQAEPWGPQSVLDLPTEEASQSMNPDLLRSNFDLAVDNGFRRIHFWGTEWWYWLKTKKDDPSMWEAGAGLIAEKSSLFLKDNCQGGLRP